MTARAGLIIPSSNRMVEEEMIQAFPAGVLPHVTRLRMTGRNRGPLAELLPRVEEATRALTDASCGIVAFHCTANSMQEGQGGEERILSAIRAARAPRATTTATAIRRAFAALGARKIVLVTPYDQSTTDHEAEFLRQDGCEVLHAVGFALAGSDAYCSTPPAFWRERALAAARPDAEAYFLSCANISVFGIIAELETALDRPVVTSNQAVVWDCLVQLGCRAGGGCPGALFETGRTHEPAFSP
jgi:maleate isomerase